LLVATEPPHFLEDRRHDLARARITCAAHDVEQPLLAELFITLVERLGDAVGVDGEQFA
jgi:hypothetical protein